MDIIRASIEKPVAVIVGIILVVLFGLIGLYSMPYQLSPSVTEPEITVTTVWPGATPYEIEREIIEEQEKVLKGIPGLIRLVSSSFNTRGTVTLRFAIGTDVDDALLRVSNKLDEVPEYPENVDKPVIIATGAATSPVIWMILRTDEDNPNPVRTYRTYFENEIRQHLERVDGVADLFTAGGTEREMHITVDPEKLAAYDLTTNDIINVLTAENVNVSAGVMGVGRRDYRIRTIAEFQSPEDIEDIVLLSTGQRRILLSDVASVKFGYAKRTVAMIHNAKDGMAIGVKPEPGTNILELSDRAEVVVKSLNAGKLKDEGIYLDWVYDQRPYIRGAISLVRKNILIGGTLAITVLLIFLRSLSSMGVVATAIPISVVGTFIIMNALGRNLNVVSLAGISFAVGMLVDNAIVVLENIDRHRGMGKSPFDAAHDGTREVWGAVLTSTVTTVAVFLPVVFIKEEAGQLFRDIAIAITSSVTLSLIVSVSVIPMLSKQLFTLTRRKAAPQKGPIGWLGGKLVDMFMVLVKLVVRNWGTRLLTVILLTSLALYSAYRLFPPMEYLPQGNRNLVISILIPPPGLSYEEKEEIGHYIHNTTMPHFRKDHQGFPGIKQLFYVGSDEIMLFGALSTHEQRAGELLPLFTRVIFSVPGMFGVSSQASIFETRIGRGRTIDVDISGDDINQTVQAAGVMMGMINGQIPGVQIRPVPSLELLFPEVRLIPDRERLKAAGMNARDFGIMLDIWTEERSGTSNRRGRGKSTSYSRPLRRISPPPKSSITPLS
jgi:HAE1 family hydrophobic/amphiphilic exporter-1